MDINKLNKHSKFFNSRFIYILDRVILKKAISIYHLLVVFSKLNLELIKPRKHKNQSLAGFESKLEIVLLPCSFMLERTQKFETNSLRYSLEQF